MRVIPVGQRGITRGGSRKVSASSRAGLHRWCLARPRRGLVLGAWQSDLPIAIPYWQRGDLPAPQCPSRSIMILVSRASAGARGCQLWVWSTRDQDATRVVKWEHVLHNGCVRRNRLTRGAVPLAEKRRDGCAHRQRGMDVGCDR